MTTAEQLAALRATVEAFMAHSREAQDDVAKSQHELTSAVAALTRAVEKIEVDMAEVKPVTDMVTSIRARLTGAVMVVGFLGAVALNAIYFFKETVMQALGWGG